MSGNLNQRIRRVVAEQTEESQSDAVTAETLKDVLCGNAGLEPAAVERALDDLVADGTLTKTDDGYRLSADA